LSGTTIVFSGGQSDSPPVVSSWWPDEELGSDGCSPELEAVEGSFVLPEESTTGPVSVVVDDTVVVGSGSPEVPDIVAPPVCASPDEPLVLVSLVALPGLDPVVCESAPVPLDTIESPPQATSSSERPSGQRSGS